MARRSARSLLPVNNDDAFHTGLPQRRCRRQAGGPCSHDDDIEF